MARQKKFRIINFYVDENSMRYGLYVEKQFHDLGDGRKEIHTLKDPFGVNKLVGKKYNVYAIDGDRKLELPIFASGNQTPFIAHVFLNIPGFISPKEKAELEMARVKIHTLEAQNALLTEEFLTIYGRSKLHKLMKEKHKEVKEVRDIDFIPRSDEEA